MLERTTTTDPAIIAMLRSRLFEAVQITRHAAWASLSLQDDINFHAYENVAHNLEERFSSYAEVLADRLDTLGETITVAEKNDLIERMLPEDEPNSNDPASHVEALLSAIHAYGCNLKQNVDEAYERGDLRTFELCYDMAHGTETTLWELKSHVVH